MFIHNFYADVAISIRPLFNNYIFERADWIKRYEFNIGNRTFQLPENYKPNFEFPNMMVTLNDETSSFGQKPDVSMKLNGFNTDQTPVLFDKTNGTFLYVQEEMVNLPITCVINCESQLQAKEIAAVCRRWLPINKFIQFMEFSSFLEISPQYLDDNQFNPSKHDIVNIYTKLNHRTGEIDYCFSLSYKPMIRADSISTSIPDSTQRSFQVTLELTYMIQMPLYLFSDKLPDKVERIDITMPPGGITEPISDYPIFRLTNGLNEDPDLKNGYVRRQFVTSEDTSVEKISLQDTVTLAGNQVDNTSTGGRNIAVTQGADDKLYITVDGKTDTVYKVPMDTIPEEGVNIPINDNEYLLVSKTSSNEYITSLYQKTKELTVQFDPNDFEITSEYTYNLISGSNVKKDYPGVVDATNNSVTFSFLSSEYPNFVPTITRPLVIQFYVKDKPFPFQIGGISPSIANVKVTVLRDTTVGITWTTGVQTLTRLEYGLTEEYGVIEEIQGIYRNTHNKTICGLMPNTLYHFRINTFDRESSSYLSGDFTFTTLP